MTSQVPPSIIVYSLTIATRSTEHVHQSKRSQRSCLNDISTKSKKTSKMFDSCTVYVHISQRIHCLQIILSSFVGCQPASSKSLTWKCLVHTTEHLLLPLFSSSKKGFKSEYIHTCSHWWLTSYSEIVRLFELYSDLLDMGFSIFNIFAKY